MTEKSKSYAKERSRQLFVAGGHIDFSVIEEELAKAFDAGVSVGLVEAHKRETVSEVPEFFARELR